MRTTLLALLLIGCLAQPGDSEMADTILTEAATWTAQTIVPTPADPVRGGVGNPGSVRKMGQELANRASYLRPALEEVIRHTLVHRVVLDVTLTTVTMEPLGTVALWADDGLLQNTTSWPEGLGNTITAAGKTPGTWYYLYLYDSGGATLALMADTTAPGVGPTYMTGDNRKRYVGAVYVWDSDGAGTPGFLPKRQIKGHSIYDFEGPTYNGHAIPITLNTTNAAGTWANIACVGQVPHARVVDLFVSGQGHFQGGDAVQVRRHGNTLEARTLCRAAFGTNPIADFQFQQLSFGFAGHNGAFGITFPQASAGDLIVQVWNITDGTDGSASFEGGAGTPISTSGQIAQTSGADLSGKRFLGIVAHQPTIFVTGLAPIETDDMGTIDYQTRAGVTLQMNVAGYYE